MFKFSTVTIVINLAVSMRGSMVDLLNQTINPSPCVHDNFFKQKYRNQKQTDKLTLEFRNNINSLAEL